MSVPAPFSPPSSPLDIPSLLLSSPSPCIFLTGVSGFVGSVVLSHLVSLLPPSSPYTLYVLIRSLKGQTSAQRLTTLLSTHPLFATIRLVDPTGKWMDKVIPLDGDIEHNNFHLSQQTAQSIQKQVNIIIPCAASVSFSSSLQSQIKTNSVSMKHLISFASKCSQLKSLTYVSTAYSNGFLDKGTHVFEKLYLGETALGCSAAEFIERILAMKEDKAAEFGAKVLQNLHFPSNYFLTKWLAERLLYDVSLSKHHGSGIGNDHRTNGAMKSLPLQLHIPISIVRPSIVGCTSHLSSAPGFIGNKTGLTAGHLAVSSGMVPFTTYQKESIIDIIPCDTCADVVIAAAANGVSVYQKYYDGDDGVKFSPKSSEDFFSIYHVASSFCNPVKFFQTMEPVRVFSYALERQKRKEKQREMEKKPKDQKDIEQGNDVKSEGKSNNKPQRTPVATPCFVLPGPSLTPQCIHSLFMDSIGESKHSPPSPSLSSLCPFPLKRYDFLSPTSLSYRYRCSSLFGKIYLGAFLSLLSGNVRKAKKMCGFVDAVDFLVSDRYDFQLYFHVDNTLRLISKLHPKSILAMPSLGILSRPRDWIWESYFMLYTAGEYKYLFGMKNHREFDQIIAVRNSNSQIPMRNAEGQGEEKAKMKVKGKEKDNGKGKGMGNTNDKSSSPEVLQRTESDSADPQFHYHHKEEKRDVSVSLPSPSSPSPLLSSPVLNDSHQIPNQNQYHDVLTIPMPTPLSSKENIYIREETKEQEEPQSQPQQYRKQQDLSLVYDDGRDDDNRKDDGNAVSPVRKLKFSKSKAKAKGKGNGNGKVRVRDDKTQDPTIQDNINKIPMKMNGTEYGQQEGGGPLFHLE